MRKLVTFALAIALSGCAVKEYQAPDCRTYGCDRGYECVELTSEDEREAHLCLPAEGEEARAVRARDQREKEDGELIFWTVVAFFAAFFVAVR